MVLKGFRSVCNKLLERADVRPQHDGGDDSASTGDANVSNLNCSVVGTVRRETGFHNQSFYKFIVQGWMASINR